MWRKREESDDGKALATRLASVLGVSLDDSGTAPVDPPAAQTPSNGNGNGKADGDLAESLAGSAEATPNAEPGVEAEAPRGSTASYPAPPPTRWEPYLTPPISHSVSDDAGRAERTTPTRFVSEPSWLTHDTPAPSVERIGGGFGVRPFAGDSDTAEITTGRAQSPRGQTEEMISALNSTLTRFSRDTHEAAQAQIKSFERTLAELFEQNLARFSDQIASRTQAGVEAVSSQVEMARAQSATANSALLATLDRFNLETRDGAKAHALAFEEKLAGLLKESLAGYSQQIAAQSQAGIETTSRGAEEIRVKAEEATSRLQQTLAQLTEATQAAAQAQAGAFEEKLAALLNQSLSRFSDEIGKQARAGAEIVESRLEAARTEAGEIGSALQASLARFNKQSEQTSQAQLQNLSEKLAGLFDENLARFSEQIASHTRAGTEAVGSQVEQARSQADAIGGALEATFVRFEERAQQAAQAQVKALEGRLADLFDQNLSRFSEQVASHAQATLQPVSNLAESSRVEAEQVSAELQKTLAGFNDRAQLAAQAQIGALEEKLTALLAKSLSEFSEQIAAQGRAALDAVSARAQDSRTQAQEISASLEKTLSDFSRQTRDAAAGQAKAFEERMNELAGQIAQRAQKSAEDASSRLEAGRAQSAEINTAIEQAVARFKQETEASALNQGQALEVKLAALFDKNLNKFSERIASRTQAGLDAVSTHVEKTRVQAEKLTASLQSTLADFSQRAEGTAASQVKSFEKRLTGILEQSLAKFSEKINAHAKAATDAAAKNSASQRAQSGEAHAALESTLARISHETRDAVRQQNEALESRLNQVAAQMEHAQAQIETVSSELKVARAGSQEAGLAFEAGLERFNDKIQNAAEAQTRAFETSLSGIFQKSLTEFSQKFNAQTETSVSALSARVMDSRSQAEAVNASVEQSLARFGKQTQKAAEAQAQAFQANLGKIAEGFVARAQTSLEGVSERLEGTRAQAEAMNLALESTLARFAEKTRKAGQVQTEAFAENLAKLSESFVTRSQAGIEEVVKRLDGARSQAESVNSSLETTLAQFGEKTRGAAEAQAQAFEAHLSETAERITAAAQAGLEGVSNRLEAASARTEGMNTALEATLAQFAEKTRGTAESQTQAFEAHLTEITGRLTANAQNGLEGISSRLEAAGAHAQMMNATLETTLAQFAGGTRSAAKAQMEAFEQGLSKVAQQIEAKSQAGLESISNQVEETRTQAEAVSAAVGAALTHFTRKTQEASQAQTKTFEQILGRICRDVVSQTQKNLEGLAQKLDTARAQAEQTSASVEEALKRFKLAADQAPHLKPDAPSKTHTGWMAIPAARYAAMGLGGLALVAIVAGLGVLLSGGLGHPRMYKMPAGYQGWVLVKYKNPTCPPLSSSGIYSVVQVSASGDACTSDVLPSGIQDRKYQAAKPGGGSVEMQDLGWDSSSQVRFLGASTNGEYELIFVGSNDDLSRSWDTMPKLPGLEASVAPPAVSPRGRPRKPAHSSN